jgi:alpha-amylase
LAKLPDLKTENPYVSSILINWIKDFVKQYNIDGIRIDTIPEVPKWFWTAFSESAGVYQVGEVFDSRMDFIADYQNHVDALLHYPLYFTLKNCFQNKASFHQMESTLADSNKHFKDVSVLGVFVDNHDNARFLRNTASIKNFRNALAFSLLTSKFSILNPQLVYL